MSLLIYLSLSPRRPLSLRPLTLPRSETANESHHRARRDGPAPRPLTNLSSATTDKSHLRVGRQFPLSHLLIILAPAPAATKHSSFIAIKSQVRPAKSSIPSFYSPPAPLTLHNSLYSHAPSLPSHSLDAAPTHRMVFWSHPYYCP